MPGRLSNGSVVIRSMRIDPLSPAQAVERIVTSPDGGCVLTPNLDHLHAHARSPAVRAAYARCELVLPDGMPLVWASRLQGTPLPERVAGSDLVFTLSQAAAERGRSLFLLGGAPGTADAAATELRRRYPGLGVAGTHCPPLGFERSPAAVAALTEAVAATGPDLVYIGLPLARQLVVMETLREVVPRAWQIGLGVSFSFVTGDVRRAPTWMRRGGLEWLFRLSQEPQRLARRYLVEGLPCFALLLASAALSRARA